MTRICFIILTLITVALFVEAQSQTQTQTQPQTLQTMPAPKLSVSKRGNQIATLKGTGDQNTKILELKDGQATFNILLDWEKRDPDLKPGEGKFSVVLQDDQGRDVETIVGTIGHFDGARTVKIPKAGKYKLKITAPGPWTVTVEQ